MTALIMTAAVIFSLFALVACSNKNKTDKFGLTDTQREKIFEITEAFYESGYEMDQNNALTAEDMIDFVCYIYNSVLEADEGGFGEIEAKEADKKLKEYFDYTPLTRNSAEKSIQKGYYYAKGVYYVKTNRYAAKDISIVSVEANDDGMRVVELKVVGANGGESNFKMAFKFDGDSIRVTACSRTDEK